MAEKTPTPLQIAREARAALRAKADPVRARGAERYFKDTIKSFGVASPDVRDLAAAFYARVKGHWSYAEAVALCDILFADAELEAKAIGGLILSRYKKDYPPAFFAKVKRWLADDLLDNWASVDVFCTDAVSGFLGRYPAYAEKLQAWTRHPNRWVKRAALVSFIPHARRGRFLDQAYGVAASVFRVEDDLVEKAAGWLLREAGKTDPARLEAFLRAHGPAIPRTTLRYAIERFPPARRRALLLETK
ncbi:MAG: DNA alkylation repair protein [Acidobacteria bacterium]|nr:DNA alkylation repair protein [Acidobacteriota bacterium]